jgi:hypothetical protein
MHDTPFKLICTNTPFCKSWLALQGLHVFSIGMIPHPSWRPSGRLPGHPLKCTPLFPWSIRVLKTPPEAQLQWQHGHAMTAHPGRVQVVEREHVDVERQRFQVEHRGCHAGALDLRHGRLGHLGIKKGLGVQAVALAVARAPGAPRSLRRLHPARKSSKPLNPETLYT